jgi:tetratricopeptide (TPR) repeat protein
LGDFLARQGRYSDAAAMFARAAKADRASALAVFLHGWALKQAGDEKEGGRLMDLAHWIPLGNERDRGEFAKELDRRGFADDARRERDLVLQAGWYRSWHVGNVLDVAGRLALKTRDYDRTILYYEKAIAGCMRQNARFVEYHSYLDAPQSVVQVRIQQLLAEKKFDEAVAQIRVCLDALPGNIKVLSNSIPLLDEAGKKREADELFNEVSGRLLKAVGAYPNSAFLHNSYAWLAATCRRDLDQALQHAQKAVRLSTSRTDYLDTLAEIYFRKGNIAKAKEIM